MNGWVLLYNPNEMVYQAITGPEPIRQRHRMKKVLNAALTVFQIWIWLKNF